jgi:uncharacterized lipoprotein YddW (UPF0748 family)
VNMRRNKFRQIKFVFGFVFFIFLSLIVLPSFSKAQSSSEYRAYWAETFNTQMGTRAEIDRIVDAAVQSNANAIFAQVRRRGDSWYLDTKEPLTQVTGVGEPDASGKWTIDPLSELIDRAHARGIEVHAFVIVGSIYNAHPTITGLPRDPNHVFNRHFWDTTTNMLIPHTDSRQWATRSLPHNPDGTTFNGQRYGAEWYVDLGHPDAAAYTVEVLTHLVRQYNLDGLHLDRIRYPEAPIDRPAGQPLGINTGYNETSVNRFKALYGNQATYYQESDIGTNVGTTAAPRYITAADVGYPKTNDPLWNNWRREQVTNVVRRIYLNATAVKPRIKVSAALICFWTGPVGSNGWERTEAYYRVFQDWKTWAEEGTLDIISPMIYKREHSSTERPQYDDWLTFTKQLAQATERHSLPGLGVYLNGIEGSLRQTRRALARPPYETSNAPAANGVIFYALGNTLPGVTTNNSTNAAVTNNPFSYPTTGISTPKRPNADFFAALRTGASASGTTRLESEMLAPLFPTVVPVPDMLWKSQPTEGYIMGFAKRADERPLDSATVTITNLNTGSTRTTVTDGGGFYGGVKLTPGQYLVKANVSAGTVTTANLQPDITAPEITLTANPNRIFPPNGQSVTVTLSGGGSDTCSGLASVSYVVIDEYGTTLNIPARTLSGNSDSWTDSLIVEASRRGDDSDGRLYRVTATIMDAAGNTSTATADIVIQHDRGNR